jgi:PAS domain S-box-containing protein
MSTTLALVPNRSRPGGRTPLRDPRTILASDSLEDAAQQVVRRLGGSTRVRLREPDGPVRLLAAASDGAVEASEAAGAPATAETADGRTVEVSGPDADGGGADAELAAVLIAGLADRLAAIEKAALIRERLDDNERIGSLGSYDWDIRRDRNDWSDELYRIYGFEPGALEPTYERFIALLHPDDRDRIRDVHRRALEERAPYEMEERIIRPDGEVRTLWSFGEVICDDDGEPVRMIGVCRDITEQRAAEQRAARNAARMRTLVDANPDAILLVDRDGRIVATNPSAEQLFGSTRDELIGSAVERLVPDASRARHAADRAAFIHEPVARPMAAGLDLSARRADGTTVPVDIALAPIVDPEGAVVAAFVRDATIRRQAEADRRSVTEAEQRRRQALELNDSVVQGLVTLLWSLDRGDDDDARSVAERTLAAARGMMNDLLVAATAESGTLVRATPAGGRASAPSRKPGSEPPGPAATERPAGGARVLLADDAPDLRLLLRRHMRRVPALEVVAEASDGRQAVDLATEHRPDVVVLDLGMPRVDGLQAASEIRELLPEARIIVLSGYPAEAMRAPALAAGADEYVEKSGDLAAIVAAIAAPTAV